MLFKSFIKQFHHFFHSCELGFRNEFIIQLYYRNHAPGVLIQSYGREASEVVLITSGLVEMFDKDDKKFMQLPPDAIFNDYTLLFNLKSNIQYKAYTPAFISEKQMKSQEN